MLRAIIRQKIKDGVNGGAWEALHTIDFDNSAIETLLSGGGCNETGYDISELVGVELLSQTLSGAEEESLRERSDLMHKPAEH